MENLNAIISSGAVSVAVSGALVFLFRNWISERMKGAIQHEYAQKLETLKAQLQSQNEIELIKLKASLEVAAAERNLRFSRVFEKTAETIATTYQKLLLFRNLVTKYVFFADSEAGGREQIQIQVDSLNQDFINYFEINQIYIPKSTADKIEGFSNTLVKMKEHYDRMNRLEMRPRAREEDIKGEVNKFLEMLDKSSELLPLLKDDFQKILGFPIEEKTTAKT